MSIAYSYIRFSTAEQSHGRSADRQLERAQNYCRLNGLTLDTSTHLDSGVSAYHGKNARVGALGRFLEAVEEGRIKAGSSLLIENLDRLSREDIESAQDLFKRILKSGISIVTLSDGKVYSKESLKDPFSIIQAILYMSRAHEESQIKSKRVADAWKHKREKLREEGKMLTLKAPLWLRYDESSKKFVPISDRVKIIRQIFAWTAEGFGKGKITKMLNEEKVPSFKTGSSWNTSSVGHILINEALIGHYQPHRLIDGKRVPDGEPVKDYFPAVLDEKDFYLAQKKRGKPLRGPSGGMVHNLLTGVAKCGFCGSTMVYVSKGKPSERYLVCSTAKKGAGCQYVSVRYEEAEAIFLGHCRKELDLNSIIAPGQKSLSKKVQALKTDIAGTESLVEEKKKNLKNLMVSFSQSDNQYVKESFEELIETTTAEIDKLAKSLEQQRESLHDLQYSHNDLRGKLSTIVDLSEKLKDVKVRGQVRNTIRDAVERIEIWPTNSLPVADRVKAFYKGKPAPVQVNLSPGKNMDPDRAMRMYGVRFKNGGAKLIFPSLG
jgi:DNA invertase Pin-like site-specific DNA recombinase